MTCHPTIQCRAKVRMSVRTDMTRFLWRPVAVLTQMKVTILLGQSQSKISEYHFGQKKNTKIPKTCFHV